MGSCKYKYPFNLIIPGTYLMTVLHTHQNFTAVKEFDIDYAEPVGDFVIFDYKL
jgi:hypothetical protein